jgi:hypothetical protein
VLGSEIKVSLKYCGCCNPLIDLIGLGRELRAAIAEDAALRLRSSPGPDADTAIVLCGCPRACGNKEEVRAGAARCIVVAGETVDMAPVVEKDISQTVIRKLKSGELRYKPAADR